MEVGWRPGNESWGNELIIKFGQHSCCLHFEYCFVQLRVAIGSNSWQACAELTTLIIFIEYIRLCHLLYVEIFIILQFSAIYVLNHHIHWHPYAQWGTCRIKKAGLDVCSHPLHTVTYHTEAFQHDLNSLVPRLLVGGARPQDEFQVNKVLK